VRNPGVKTVRQRIVDLEKVFTRPLPGSLRVHPEPEESEDPPRLDLGALSLATKLEMMQAIRASKPEDWPSTELFSFNMALFPDELRAKVAEELHNAQHQQETPAWPSSN
jgi:hypothetical protein